MSAEEPSWSGGACPSRLTTVGQSRSQALHTKGYPFLISGLLPDSNQISQKSSVKWWLPQRVPVCVKTGEREREREKSWWVPTEQKSAGRSSFCEEAVGLSTPLSCSTRAMVFERAEPEGEKRGGWRYPKAVRGVNWVVWRNPYYMYPLWARIAATGKTSANPGAASKSYSCI